MSKCLRCSRHFEHPKVLKNIYQGLFDGNPIAKNLIPEEYKLKFGTKNLFRVELPAFWRMLYTLTNNEEVEIIAFILDIIDHSTYDNKFGYRGR